MKTLFLSIFMMMLSFNSYSQENSGVNKGNPWHIHNCEAGTYSFTFNQITGEFTHNFAGGQSETTVVLDSLGFDPEGVLIENEDGTVEGPIYFTRWTKYEAPGHHGNLYDILNIQLSMVSDRSFAKLFFYQPGVAIISETFTCLY
jgi:hypothetical protein